MGEIKPKNNFDHNFSISKRCSPARPTLLFNFVRQIFENENGTQLSYCNQEDSLSDPAAGSLRIDGLVRGSLCLVAVRAKHLFGRLASP